MNVTIGIITIAHLIQTNNVFSKLAHIRILFLKDNRESKWTAYDAEWRRLHNVIFKMLCYVMLCCICKLSLKNPYGECQ